jgi:hypothetical protein
MKHLVGATVKDIIYQPVAGLLSDGNMFVINLKNNTSYSLHTFCSLRIIHNGEIVLTSSDEYFDKNFNKLDAKDYEAACGNKFINTLLSKNISYVKRLLKSSKIQTISISETADIKIVFDNNVTFEIVPDCLYEGYEYYRFIDATHNHYVVGFNNKAITCSVYDSK